MAKPHQVAYMTKVRCLILSILAVGLYLLDSPYMMWKLPGQLLLYVIKPVLWIGVSILVFAFPKAQPKGKYKIRKELNWWAFNFAFIYIIVLLAAGLIDGLGKSPYSHTLKGILLNMIIIVPVLIGRETIRSYIVNSTASKDNYLTFALIALFMTITNIPLNRFLQLNGYIDVVKFIAEYFAPEFCHNLLVTFMVFLGGALTSIIYLGIIIAFHWLSPILPDLKWITTGLVGVLYPVYTLMFIQNKYLVTAKQKMRRDNKESLPSLIFTSIISIAIVWFAVGVFPLYPSVVATGSMEPMIKPGDVIVLKKSKGSDVKVGDVVQFRRESILISHRIIDILEDNDKKKYQTKGDNNSLPDSELVEIENVKGTVIFVIPKVGWPTLLIKSKHEIQLEEIVF